MLGKNLIVSGVLLFSVSCLFLFSFLAKARRIRISLSQPGRTGWMREKTFLSLERTKNNVLQATALGIAGITIFFFGLTLKL